MASRPRRASKQQQQPPPSPPPPKQDQSRAKWTTSLTMILADLMVDQVLKGNRQNNSFGKKTWKYICDGFYKKTGLKWDKEQLKNRYGVLRRQYVTVKSLLDQNDFCWDESQHIVTAKDEVWDKYIKEHPDAETIRNNGCPIYKQLCTIFSESGTYWNYDQPNHYLELEGTPKLQPCSETVNPVQLSILFQEESSSDSEEEADIAVGQDKCQSTTPHNSHRHKRRCNKIDDVMAEAILEMAAASKLRAAAVMQSRDRFPLTNCIKALDEMQGVNDQIYLAALDLFDKPNARETFISLKSDKRLTWLKGKCNISL
ncbi:hypothetical protein HHK36_008693 [Tetracentron sinense]|uniref:Myb/SANT-like domain-containing protein n=1 Tax=Tetracentron sinense TaxID=13715 RepID=A0A834ZFW8_TETSI|nr:hypothetical protein HHK36_008693 [Tetracentron sinense]